MRRSGCCSTLALPSELCRHSTFPLVKGRFIRCTTPTAGCLNEYQIRPAFLVETGDFSFLLVLSSALLWWQFSAHRRKCFPSWGRRLLSCMRSAGCTNRLRAGTAGSGVLVMCLSAAPRAAFKGLERRDFHFFLQQASPQWCSLHDAGFLCARVASTSA